jgi:hypothetical protein
MDTAIMLQCIRGDCLTPAHIAAVRSRRVLISLAMVWARR